MDGIGPELPLSKDHRFGAYSLVLDYKDEVRQNFKILLMTSPGERIMDPDFGVGLRKYLFEPRAHSKAQIEQRIESQIRRYMPFIKINRLLFDNKRDENILGDSSHMTIRIEYEVPSLNLSTSIILQNEDIN
jgi:phage baseplate assembly protein W